MIKYIILFPTIIIISLYFYVRFKFRFWFKQPVFHIHNIFNGYEGAKKWRNEVAQSIKTKNLKNLLNFIECDSIKII